MNHSSLKQAFVGCRTTKERDAQGVGISVLVQDGQHWKSLQTVETYDNPSWLVHSQAHDMLYACHGDRTSISSYRIEPSTGRLHLTSRIEVGGANPVHAAELPGGLGLICANYQSGNVVLLPIGPQGELQGVAQTLNLFGLPGPRPAQRDGSHPHQVAISPTGRFVLVPDKGLDRVFILELDLEGNRMNGSGISSVSFHEGSGPRHLVFHPERPIVYLVGELDSTLITCRWDEAKGHLIAVDRVSLLPEHFSGDSTGSGIAMSQDARFVYVSNRGHDHVVCFELDADALPRSPKWTPAGGRFPRFISLGPDPDELWVANERSHLITRFKGASTGQLAQDSRGSIATASPVAIAFRRPTDHHGHFESHI